MSDLSDSDNRDTQNAWARPAFLCALIAFSALMRVVPHPPNFAPVGAIALFGGAVFASRWAAFGVPLVSMLISDVVLWMMHGYPISPVSYACFVFYVVLGYAIRTRRTVLPIAGAALLGSIVFYLATNAAAWWELSVGPGADYTRDFSGLMASYVTALPFYQPTLIGDAIFTVLLFGGLALAEWKVPALKPQSNMQPIAA